MSNHNELNLNFLLLKSIPLDKDLKRYFISKYKHMVRCNGLEFANSKFKSLLTSLKTYKATGKLPALGIRQNGWVKKIINYVDCQPHHVFNFLKGIYSWKGEINVDETSRCYHRKLSDKREPYEAPSYLTLWLGSLGKSKEQLYVEYWENRRRNSSLWHRYCKHHSVNEWLRYWFQWKHRFRFPSKEEIGSQASLERPVFPEMYKDYDPTRQEGSSSLERDLVNFLMHLVGRDDIPVEPPPSILVEYLLHNKSEEIKDMYYEMYLGNYPLQFRNTDFMSGAYVGDIHYIPKGGTGFRPIAVPNRFLQEGLVPLYGYLKILLGRLSTDATFDQEKFDPVIQSRVTTDSRFVGSVDLTEATDNLPMDWILWFVTKNILPYPKGWESLRLFQYLARSQWNNDGYMSRWTVGQPLGTLPSFCWLGLTHNIFLESLSLWLGFGHSPYRVLGDDVVIFSKRLHRNYIREFSKRGIPLSLTKTYSGKLTEFAGKTFIKRLTPFLTPDHNVVTFSNLFDWQFATGIRIPWRNLPRKIHKRITRYTGKLAMSGQQCYELIQYLAVPSRGSTRHPFPDKKWEDMLVQLWLLLEEEILEPDHGQLHTGIICLQDMVGVINSQPLEMGGYFRRYYQTRLPEWYRRKFRPTTTDRFFSTAVVAAEKVGLLRK